MQKIWDDNDMYTSVKMNIHICCHILPHLKLHYNLVIFWLPVDGKLSILVKVEPVCPLERLRCWANSVLTCEWLMALHTDSWHFVLFRKASQQLEKSTDLCPHVPPGGPPALRGTFAPPWPLVISLHRPFYAPFLFSSPQSSLSFLWVLQICKEFPLLMFWLLTASPRPDQTVHSTPDHCPLGMGTLARARARLSRPAECRRRAAQPDRGRGTGWSEIFRNAKIKRTLQNLSYLT